MDMINMGSFLAKLRKDHNLTQAELGEKLGVTNKTVSRWETGNYMPPVEMLEELSKLYGLSINELLSGRKLSTEEYKEMAEENIKETLGQSVFSLKEKETFFKKKWIKCHFALIALMAVAWVLLVVTLSIKGIEIFLVSALGGFLALLIYTVLHNEMMAYVERNIYGGRGTN